MTLNGSQKAIEESLTRILASSARVAVLRLFMLDPRRSYYQRQIEGATGLPLRAIQRELDRLGSAGLLYRRAEGNRTYYQVDLQHPLFPELRGMVLKAAAAHDYIRGIAAVDEDVRAAFLNATAQRVLIVTHAARRPSFGVPAPYTLEIMSSEEFERALVERSAALADFLGGSVDMLGRRDDVIWRRIEAAGHAVDKGKGVA
ncbi:MAG: winged helix-turn-helix transcriptional regulator [Candidatus Hydrogenedentes bacterium]|nr:winged helix-turn-helix transcriptional regulator [Candidatus Hydrogenedentota bacterium]